MWRPLCLEPYLVDGKGKLCRREHGQGMPPWRAGGLRQYNRRYSKQVLTWRVYTCSSRSSQTQSDTPHLSACLSHF